MTVVWSVLAFPTSFPSRKMERWSGGKMFKPGIMGVIPRETRMAGRALEFWILVEIWQVELR